MESASKMDYINHLDQLLRSESPNVSKKYTHRPERDELPELDHLRYNGSYVDDRSPYSYRRNDYSPSKRERPNYSPVKRTPERYRYRNVQSDPFDTPSNHIQQSYRQSKQEYIPQRRGYENYDKPGGKYSKSPFVNDQMVDIEDRNMRDVRSGNQSSRREKSRDMTVTQFDISQEIEVSSPPRSRRREQYGRKSPMMSKRSRNNMHDFAEEPTHSPIRTGRFQNDQYAKDYDRHQDKIKRKVANEISKMKTEDGYAPVQGKFKYEDKMKSRKNFILRSPPPAETENDGKIEFVREAKKMSNRERSKSPVVHQQQSEPPKSQRETAILPNFGGRVNKQVALTSPQKSQQNSMQLITPQMVASEPMSLGSPVKKHKPLNGQNTKKFQNGSIYIGKWKNDKRHGYGQQTWPDGTIYEGEWHNDKIEGAGKLIHSNGDVYSGNWKDNMAWGEGSFHHSNGGSYQGFWMNDMQNGMGRELSAEGNEYQGEYKDGRKHGNGEYIWMDGSSYNGEWSNNKMEGRGVFCWPDGKKYEGTWKNSKMHGNGSFTWMDGSYYKGGYHFDKKHGEGEMGFCNGKVYIGHWHHGVPHGTGTVQLPTGEQKQGQWMNGRRIKWL